MKRVFTLIGLFACTCLVGIELSIIAASDAAAYEDLYVCNSPSTCSSVTPYFFYSCDHLQNCQGDQYVLWQCTGRCTGTNSMCNCSIYACWTQGDPFTCIE